MTMKILYLTISTLFLACAALMLPSTAIACRAPHPSPQAVVSGAEMIIRATAIRYLKAPEGNLRQLNEPNDTEIKFRVEETLKGENVPSTIILNGYLSERDDFNDRPVPYDFVRPGGRRGSCSAYEYKQGAEFLLFLKRIDGRLTIRWYALAPTNEQLHSADDPWIIWVKKQLKSPEGKESSVSAGFGVEMVTDGKTRDDLIELIETRNVFVHNRGRIGAKYPRNVANTTFALGQERLIDLDYLVHAIPVLLSCANPLDRRLAKKFALAEIEEE